MALRHNLTGILPLLLGFSILPGCPLIKDPVAERPYLSTGLPLLPSILYQ